MSIGDLPPTSYISHSDGDANAFSNTQQALVNLLSNPPFGKDFSAYNDYDYQMNSQGYPNPMDSSMFSQAKELVTKMKSELPPTVNKDAFDRLAQVILSSSNTAKGLPMFFSAVHDLACLSTYSNSQFQNDRGIVKQQLGSGASSISQSLEQLLNCGHMQLKNLWKLYAGIESSLGISINNITIDPNASDFASGCSSQSYADLMKIGDILNAAQSEGRVSLSPDMANALIGLVGCIELPLTIFA